MNYLNTIWNPIWIYSPLFLFSLLPQCDKIFWQKQKIFLEGKGVYFGLEFQRNGVTTAERCGSSRRAWQQQVAGEGRWLFTLHPCSGSRELIASGARLLSLKASHSDSLPPARCHLLKDLQHSKTASRVHTREPMGNRAHLNHNRFFRAFSGHCNILTEYAIICWN